MDQCVDCSAPAVESGRCADCLAEVEETPNWRGDPPRNCRWCAIPVPPSRPQRAWCSTGCKDRSLGRDGAACSSPACGKPVKLGGLCVTHYFRNKGKVNSDRRAAAKRGLATERVDRGVVGERDGWRCGICSRRVDRRRIYPDPMSPSLDHIIPLSHGGPHSYTNTRIAHLSCNVSRGNRGGGEQLALLSAVITRSSQNSIGHLSP